MFKNLLVKGRDLFKVGEVNELDTDLEFLNEGISRIYTHQNSTGIEHTLIFTIYKTHENSFSDLDEESQRQIIEDNLDLYSEDGDDFYNYDDYVRFTILWAVSK